MAYGIKILDTPTQAGLVLLGNTFATLRRSHGYSQRALAARCRLSQSSISRFENGKAPWLSALYLGRMLSARNIASAEFGFRPRAIRWPARDWLLVAIEAINAAEAAEAAEARNNDAVNDAARP